MKEFPIQEKVAGRDEGRTRGQYGVVCVVHVSPHARYHTTQERLLSSTGFPVHPSESKTFITTDIAMYHQPSRSDQID